MRKKPYGRGAENFVFTVLQQSKAGKARLVGISGALGTSRAAVSRMASRLARGGLVVKGRYSLVGLTAKGRALANETAMKHRVVEVFLHDALGMEGDEMEEQAHELEHAISARTARRLHAYLGKPRLCPHGKEIGR